VLCLTGVRNNKCKTPFHTRLPVFFGDPVTLIQPEPTQRRQAVLPAGRSPSLLLALGSFMQILVDLVMNERSVRRPHALDPGHDLPLRREISLTIATVYPVPPPESHGAGCLTAACAYPLCAIRMPLFSLDVQRAETRAKLTSDDECGDGEGLYV
jgi:hypothetical protein